MNQSKFEKMQLLRELIAKYVDHGPNKYTATQVADELEKISGTKFDSNKLGQSLQFQGFAKCGKIPIPTKYKNKTFFTAVYSLTIGAKKQFASSDYVIQFGKYCGYRLSEINDLGYLIWMRNTIQSLSAVVVEKIDARIEQLRKPVQPLLQAILPEGDYRDSSAILTLPDNKIATVTA